MLAKARFWEKFGAAPLNERQRKVVNRLLDGFEGKLTTSKYAKLTKCSQDTALRDILSLVERGILVRGEAAGEAPATRWQKPDKNDLRAFLVSAFSGADAYLFAFIDEGGNLHDKSGFELGRFGDV